jgi:DNA-binding transcriptional LysR family regulator
MRDHVIDANLVIALDALLAEQSVTRAAERLHTSPAAMSRTLGRLRRLLGDPLLVRAGQVMVPTPRAQELRDEVAAVVRRCTALLVPAADVEPATLRRTFDVQAADLVSAALTPGLLTLAAREAPGVSVRFRAEELEGGSALRDGRIDLEVGALDHVDPESRTAPLIPLRMAIGVRAGHPLTQRSLTPARLAAAAHVAVSRRGRFTGPLDTALARLSLHRHVAAVLPSHLAAMTLAARTDLVCLVPNSHPRDDSCPFADVAAMLGLQLMEIPLTLPSVPIGMAWHPRHSADGGHRWLRSAVRRALRVPAPDPGPGPPPARRTGPVHPGRGR